ncbi:MAG: universal stress protein [Nitrospirales bacterium]
MNVLLAVDPSQNSSSVTKFVEALRLPARSKLYLLYVEEPYEKLPGPDHFPRVLGQVREQLSQIRQKIMENAHQLVDRLAASFCSQDMEIHSLVVEGIPGAQILTAIEQYQIDLVALGTKGLSGMKRFLLGSVSEWVLYDASCSVLVVRERPQEAAANNSGGLRVLLAIDGSSDSWESVALLKTLKLPRSSRLTIIHVVEQPAVLITLAWISGHMDATKFAEDCKQTGREAGAQLLEKTQRDLVEEELEVHTKLLEGHAADEILKAAQGVQADLIVVGSRGMSELRRVMMLGGVAHKVVRHAECSVLVVRKRGQKAKAG